jgi:hypothetical protein
LNHFAVPVAISSSPLSAMPRRDLAATDCELPPVMAFRSG